MSPSYSDDGAVGVLRVDDRVEYSPVDTMAITTLERDIPPSNCGGSLLYHFRKNWKILLLGQVLSVFLATGGAVQATLNLDCGLSAPTFTIGVVYFFLSFHLIAWWRQLKRESLQDIENDDNFAIKESNSKKSILDPATKPCYPFLNGALRLHRPAWQYFILAFLDVQANYVTILAYRYTTLTSVTLFDSLAIPSAMLLSKFCVGRQYLWTHLLGTACCMAGVMLNIMQDFDSDKKHGASDGDASSTDGGQEYPFKLRGDLLSITGGILYGVNDVIAEVSVRAMGGTSEYLGMLGLFAFFISIVQALILERQDILEFFGRSPDETSTCSLSGGWGLYFVFVGVSACGYMGGSRFLLISEAAFFSLSLLTGDLWTLLFSVVAERIVPQPLFFFALFFVLSGVLIYEMAPSPVVEEDKLRPVSLPECEEISHFELVRTNSSTSGGS
jgi:solute carrier family 35 protein F1/2